MNAQGIIPSDGIWYNITTVMKDIDTNLAIGDVSGTFEYVGGNADLFIIKRAAALGDNITKGAFKYGDKDTGTHTSGDSIIWFMCKKSPTGTPITNVLVSFEGA